jgi:hypothetical protein
MPATESNMHALPISPFRTVALLLALAAGTHAQGSAGSESNVALAHEVIALGGRALGSSGAPTAATLGQVATGPIAASESFRLHAGVAWTVPAVPGTTPIVFGPSQASGDKDGGDVVSIFGYNFQAPGAGPLVVSFGVKLGTGTAVLSNTRASSTSPGEVDAIGNPPPGVSVGVSNGNGAHSARPSALQASYLYEPALVPSDHARVGRQIHMHAVTESGAGLILVLGQTIPGSSVHVPPLEGAIEVLVNQQFAVPIQFLSGKQYRHIINVPNDPALVGASLSYQSLSLTSLPLLIGAFSNTLTLTVQP